MAKANEADKEKADKKKAGKFLIGVLACMVTVEMIILFLTLGLSLEKVVSYNITTLWQAIFIIPLHLPTFITSGMWSIMAALTIGAFIGGLVMKQIKKGILVSIISFGLLLFLQLAVGFLFNFDALIAWYSLISSLGGNVIVDFLVSAFILIAAGAIGGALTRE
ncbi:MAG: hypothetical protein HWN65_11810 [Candidatus Helarchaeota archaeon]|nr:hypothetical protein [Candidatus Helarchaeota archaeon]